MLDDLTQNIAWVLDSTSFMARGTCGQWTPLWRALAITCDLVYGISYLAIPVALVLLWVLKRRVYGKASLILLEFAGFILGCGITHFTQVAVWFYPAYRLFTLMAIPGAILSLVCMCHLPSAFWHWWSMATPGQLLAEIEKTRAANARLEAANATIQKALKESEEGRARAEAAEESHRWREIQFNALDVVRETLKRGVA